MKIKAHALRMKTRIFAPRQDFFLNLYGNLKPGTFLHAAVRSMVKTMCGPFPLVLKLDITQNCNINCTICYAKHDGGIMPFDKAVTVLGQFKKMSMRLDIMGGEPCTHPDLAGIIAYAKHHAKFSEVQVYTNATLVTREYAGILKQSGLDSAMVNLFSHDASVHDRGTGVPGSWDKTVAGMKNLVDAGISARPFIVMHRGNVSDYERIRDFSLGAFGVMPVFFQYIPVFKDDALAPDNTEWAAVKRKILYDDQPDHRRTITAVNTLCGRCCLGGYFSFSVKVNGDITPCPFIDDVVTGNIFEKTFWEAFSDRMQSHAYREFISVPDECLSCTYLEVCGGSCRAGYKNPGITYASRDHRCIGPWKERFCGDEIWNKMPTFF